MIAGLDADTATPHIYWINHLSSMCPLNFADHGYSSYYCMSTMDRYFCFSILITFSYLGVLYSELVGGLAGDVLTIDNCLSCKPTLYMVQLEYL